MLTYEETSMRLAQIEALSLKSGGHKSIEAGACVMEAVAYVAGEPWSDHPLCACPVITQFLVSWNDGLPNDAERDRLLKPLVQRVIGTRTKALEQKRSYMALDWLIRVYTPKWLDLVPALQARAIQLRGLGGVVDLASAKKVGRIVRLARTDADAAWAAAGEAARAAAGEAAWEAAWAAAREAAWAAAGEAVRAAAGEAAWDAAWAAAGEAAWDAAWDAAGGAAARAAAAAGAAAGGAAARAAAGEAARAAARAALKPTTAWLQISAVELVNAMIDA